MVQRRPLGVHFKPLRYDRWSQALEVTLGELIPREPTPLLKRRRELILEQAIKLWTQKRLPTGASARQHGGSHVHPVLLNPFCPLSTAKALSLKATLLLLLTLLIKARVQIVAGSAIGIFLLLLQTLVFLVISGGLVLAAGGAAFYSTQQRRTPVA